MPFPILHRLPSDVKSVCPFDVGAVPCFLSSWDKASYSKQRKHLAEPDKTKAGGSLEKVAKGKIILSLPPLSCKLSQSPEDVGLY